MEGFRASVLLLLLFLSQLLSIITYKKKLEARCDTCLLGAS